ncbi:polyphosphate:AMP phosphotransferase [Methylocystis parvus]|uniref:Polyphosphate:AMP phosphotransferase n=1 Tax=Methylocystis parvus TaxID=134 RepID=A0A6B8M2U7_9HYPH|nr:polyphosphate:AMP phosphotransferase [Methylocystis parvus]QGM96665.1 polyphosphate:AMP phosphotransferase [Methylocystis parvus]WBJ99473.1 polyphosphate:AMP phosphotransferase [Methylocystis parvus OBBP]
MFESARLPHVMTREEFAAAEARLRERLLDAQFEVAEQKRAAIMVLINGSDGAGKGEVVNRLYDWLDDHLVETLSYGEPTDEERARPGAWRYWRDMPAKGRIGLVLGSWHHRLLRNRALRRLDKNAYDNALEEMIRSEEMLRLEGVHLIKIWLQMDDAEAQKRLAKLREFDGALRRPAVIEWAEFDAPKARARLIDAALEMIEKTSTGGAPWAVVPASDPRYRDAAVGDLLLQTLQQAAAGAEPSHRTRAIAAPASALPRPSLVSALDLSRKHDPDAYAQELRALQRRLTEATTAKGFRDSGLVLVFEGNDAAGKGGTIRRVREALDPRRFRVHGVAAPTDEERARPYLWRFWRNVPRRGDVAIFDRSWYGRVLVERVEGFAAPEDWMRAYQEINDFERQLGETGYLVVKFWLAISQEEQLRRFQDREEKPFKRYKLTPDDWRNREKWSLYEAAMTEMIDRTSSRLAPWTMVEANDKKYARLKVLRTIVERLEA